MDDSIVTAHHEAGHVVLALLTDCELGVVRIDGGGGGLTRFRAPWRTPERRYGEAVLRHLGGPAAEAVLLGLGTARLTEAETLIEGGRTDFEAARRACAPGSGWWVSYQLEVGWRRALAMLEGRWPEVQGLAELLAVEGTLSGQRVREVVLGS